MRIYIKDIGCTDPYRVARCIELVAPQKLDEIALTTMLEYPNLYESEIKRNTFDRCAKLILLKFKSDIVRLLVSKFTDGSHQWSEFHGSYIIQYCINIDILIKDTYTD